MAELPVTIPPPLSAGKPRQPERGSYTRCRGTGVVMTPRRQIKCVVHIRMHFGGFRMMSWCRGGWWIPLVRLR
jgi:hypothetical protein